MIRTIRIGVWMVCVLAEFAVPRLTAQSPPLQPAPNPRPLEEVIRELEGMKQHVEQLEAMLKARLPDQGATPLSAAPPRPSTVARYPLAKWRSSSIPQPKLLLLQTAGGGSQSLSHRCARNSGLSDWSAKPSWKGWGAGIANARFLGCRQR